MRNSKTKKLTIMSFCIALNIIGAFVALTFRLPIYMDSIGTIMAAMLLGPKYAVITGVGGSLISGTFDVYSIYFSPVQISTGFIAGIIYKKGMLDGKNIPLGVILIALPTALISAFINVLMFGGITSSGSSYIVQVLSVIGISKITVVFLVQIITDFVDKLVASLIGSIVLSSIPSKYTAKNIKEIRR